MEQTFRNMYGRPPEWIARAPGRVNLIGEHTDYNEGYVLPMAIERHTSIAAAPNDSGVITLRSTAFERAVQIDLTHPVQPGPKGDWSNYPRGVIAGFVEAGHEIPGFDALIHSTVPLGGGLSSSAALEVATATLLEAILGEFLDPVQKALLCQKAEHSYAGVPCGIMDQFVSILGRKDQLLLLDCGSQAHTWIPFAGETVTVLIVNTNVRHQLAGSQYALRREQCESAARALGMRTLRQVATGQLERARGALEPTIFRRARHVVTEIDRTVKAATAIAARDWHTAGELMYLSHESLRNDFEVSCRELDALVEIAQNLGSKGGLYGCRMTGGGFGGCAVALIEREAVDSIMRTVANEYRSLTGIEPALVVSHPAQGVTVQRARVEEAIP